MPTHTFLLYVKEDKLYWLEHAFEVQKGIYEFDNGNNLIDHVKDKQLNYAIQNSNEKPSDRKFMKCYEYIKPEPSLDVDEYIYHVTHRFEKNK